jgi:hypothetical protein
MSKEKVKCLWKLKWHFWLFHKVHNFPAILDCNKSSPASKGKAVPLQAYSGPERSRSYGSQISWRHRMVVRLSALRTGRLNPRKYTWYSFLLEAESTPGP